MEPLVFFVNGVRVEDDQVDPESTLLQYLRLKLKLCGTKLGCAEGGCGTCTVLLSKYDRHTKQIKHYSVNACLTPICAVHGLSVTTVEGIGSIRTRLHPVQERIAAGHGSQCGFCTPGIVMSMYALLQNKSVPSIDDIETYMQGNLCRCTGYRPIWQAFKTFTEECGDIENGPCCMQNGTNGNISLKDKVCCKQKLGNGCAADGSIADQTESNSKYTPYDPSPEPMFPPELMVSDNLDNKLISFKNDRVCWYRPVTLNQIVDLKTNNPHARIVVGNSEIGVEAKFKNCYNDTMITPVLVPEMNEVKVTEEGIHLGAATSLTTLCKTIEELSSNEPDYKTKNFKAINKMLHLFAGMQIRNTASVAGNIMTGSPISDLNPLLMAAGAVLTVHSQEGKQNVKMDDKFFTGYRRTCIKNTDIVVSIFIPYSEQNEYFYGYKQSRRREDDIAIVNAGMRVKFQPNTDVIEELSLAFGGMAIKSIFAQSTMSKLRSRKWNNEMFEDACKLLENDLPLAPSAPGGMIQFRRSLTISFFFKFYLSVLSDLANKKLTSEIIPEEYVSAINDVSRPSLSSSQIFKLDPDSNGNWSTVGKPMVHLSAYKQATGEAVYIDDIPKVEGELYMALLFSTKAHARLLDVDPSEALNMSGVSCFLSAKDLTREANITGPIFKDEEIFASETVICHGQVVGAVVAVNQIIAQRAVKLVKVKYEELPAIITIEEAIEQNSFFDHDLTICNGDVEAALSASEHVISGEVRVGAQEHFYLETQATLAVPKNEDGEMEIFSSSQHPSVTQMLAAKAMGVTGNKVTCRVKRLGGGFGGKETRFHIVSTTCAVAAQKLRRPVRCMLDRDEDMISTGTRHPFLSRYKVGYNSAGKLLAMDIKLFCNAGHSIDLSKAVLERALFHCENSYKVPVIRCSGKLCKTNLPSNTAFRGFGGPQGMFMIENVIDNIASSLNKPPEQIRELNLYKEGDLTHYNQKLNNCTLSRCWLECLNNSNFSTRKESVQQYNSKNRWKKKGIAVIPTKFGISFTSKFLNQGGSLVLIYNDGSVLLSHGGVEMGQGLHTKMIQVASTVLGIPTELIHVSETCTDKVPNTSPTAASASSDLYGMAIQNACETLMDRLSPYRKKNPGGDWKSWVLAAYFDRVSLSTTGFYITPDIGYNWDTNSGNVFNYYTMGAACSEVEIDCLTGDHQVLRTDIVMDLGNSLSPAIDIGQIEGGFIQGYGLFALEEQKYLSSGALFTKGPGAYKIPGFTDVPGQFNVSLLSNAANPRAVFSSKAVGEPPLFLASSIFFAIKNAISSARSDAGLTEYFQLNSPATAEQIRIGCSEKFTQQFPPATKGTFIPWDISP